MVMPVSASTGRMDRAVQTVISSTELESKFDVLAGCPTRTAGKRVVLHQPPALWAKRITWPPLFLIKDLALEVMCIMMGLPTVVQVM